MRKTLALFLIILISSLEAKITPKLMQQINNASPHEMISCIVIMKESYPYEKIVRSSISEKIATFQNISYNSQKPLLDWLAKRSGDAEIHQKYWVLNGFHLIAKAEVIAAVANREDILLIQHNGIVRAAIMPGSYSVGPRRAVEWNVKKIMADACWEAGFTGKGIIIGITDSGVDFEHPALKGKWSGHWYVAEGHPQSETPCDDMWHGTHCMGSICGGDGLGPFENDIGVAPDIKYAAAKVLNSGGMGSIAQCIEGLQFIAGLKDSVDIKAVSNSWVEGSGTDTSYYPVCRTLKSIDILPIFAIGNTGSNAQDPGTYAVVLGVGATNNQDNLASFSAKGPAPDQPPFNDKSTWYRDDWNFIKPEICAPGENINSSEPGGGYRVSQGTSMATPHVAGAVAILSQKNPNLSAIQLYNILLDNTDEPSQGTPFPNNNYGWGRLNVYKALQATPWANQPIMNVTENIMDEIKPGETVDLKISVKNMGGVDGTNTTAKLVSVSNFITIQNASYDFGKLTPEQEASNNSSPFKVTAHNLTPAGHEARLDLIIHADGPHDTLDYDDTLAITFTVGTAPEPYVVFGDDFEYSSGGNFSANWDASGWNHASDESQSPSHSASTNSKGSTLTLKTGIDLSALHKPELVFWSRDEFNWPQEWNTCKVSASKNGGNSWENISSFTGSASGTTWRSRNVSLASFAVDNVKIRFEYTGIDKSLAQGFWIDDFKIQVKTDNEPPCFKNTTLWKDVSQTGPFTVRSTVTDVNGVKEIILYYRVDSGSWNKEVMNAQGSDVYEASIPQQNGTDVKIDYYLEATDKWIASTGNTGTFPVGADQSGNYHSFISGSTGIHPNDQAVTFYYLNSHHVNGMVNMKFYLPYVMNVKISLFDVTGKEVVKIINKKLTVGDHAIKSNVHKRIASGFYLLAFEAHPVNVTVTNRSYKKIEKVLFLN